jgi:tRNA-splicing ligase RtcB
MPVKQFLNKGRIHAKLWLDDLESSAFDQVVNLTNLPFAHHHVAIMPDSHAGRGCVA